MADKGRHHAAITAKSHQSHQSRETLPHERSQRHGTPTTRPRSQVAAAMGGLQQGGSASRPKSGAAMTRTCGNGVLTLPLTGGKSGKLVVATAACPAAGRYARPGPRSGGVGGSMIGTREESGASGSTMRTVPIPGSLPREPVGLGQLIKGATSRAGLQPCAACERRAERLDRWVRFGPVGTRGSGRRSVVVVAVTVAAAVGGAVAGGKLGRKAGSAAGTKLRAKMQHRVTRPERLDSVAGYAEQGGEILGSIVGGTVAALAVLSLANRFLGLNGGGVFGARAAAYRRPDGLPGRDHRHDRARHHRPRGRRRTPRLALVRPCLQQKR